MAAPAATPEKQEKNWWQRNWKWALPSGCLTIIVLFAACITGFVFLVFGVMKSSDVYKEAMAKVQASQAAVDALGSPIEAGLVVSGSVNTSGPSGSAQLSIPLSGPKGKGTLTLEARKRMDAWEFSAFTLKIDQTGKSIDLLGDARAPASKVGLLLQSGSRQTPPI
jgi:hypothetical protein